MVITGDFGDARTDSGMQVAEIGSWEFRRISENKKYRSNMTGGFANMAEGGKHATGSMMIFFDPAVMRKIAAGTRFSVRLYPNQLVLTDYIRATVIIDEDVITTDIDGSGIVGGSASFSAHGAWSLHGNMAIDFSVESS